MSSTPLPILRIAVAAKILTMGFEFEFSDETTLKCSALASAALAVPFLVAPKESQVGTV